MSTRELTFNKVNGEWFFDMGDSIADINYRMHKSAWPLLDYAADGRSEVTLQILRKNTLERVKISLGRSMYMKGGALYYVLDYTGARYGTKELGRKKLWIGSTTRKVLNNFPEVINITW